MIEHFQNNKRHASQQGQEDKEETRQETNNIIYIRFDPGLMES
jgi:hypothetical protein